VIRAFGAHCQARHPAAAPAGGEACAGGSAAEGDRAATSIGSKASGTAACRWCGAVSSTADVTAPSANAAAVTATSGCPTNAATPTGCCPTNAATTPTGGCEPSAAAGTDRRR
jgi:hypothetical protein